jgi:hypothetical protein
VQCLHSGGFFTHSYGISYVLVTIEGCNAAIEALKQAHAADMLVAACDFRVTHLGVTTGATKFPTAVSGA